MFLVKASVIAVFGQKVFVSPDFYDLTMVEQGQWLANAVEFVA